MPRQEDAGLLNTKSILSDLSTSTMKSDPGGPASVPGLGATLVVASSACAAAVEGRLTKALDGSASAALACLTAGIAVAAPATAAPARNLRRSTPLLAFLRVMTFPPRVPQGAQAKRHSLKIYHAAAACPIRLSPPQRFSRKL